MADTQSVRVFRFGPFEADLANRQLFKKGLPVGLTGQPFDVLALLLEHPGQLVTRKRLRTHLWPSGTVVEFDHSIAAAITKLREALGDDAQHPRFVATVPRHGYRFIASVSTAAEPVPVVAPGSPPPSATSGTAAPRQVGPAQRDMSNPPPNINSAAAPVARWLGRAIIAALAVMLTYLGVDKFWISAPSTRVQPAPSQGQTMPAPAAISSVAVFNPPLHSIAVLPFVNISGDAQQEYFSDGLTEELLSSLTRFSELHVAAQTSSFYFKGKDVDLGTIARKLNVGAVLEGSVRRSGHRLRITAQLIDAVTGYHLWSQTYDRNVGEVLSLQTEIASAVANALKVTLLSDTAATIELGGTRNPAAFDAYLRGLKTDSTVHNRKDEEAAIAAYDEAIRLDRDYALALAARAFALVDYAGAYVTGPAVRASVEAALTDARQAIARAPALAEGHLALARVLEREFLDFAHAAEEYQHAVSLAPGNALAAKSYGSFEVLMGHTDAGIDAVRRAVRLDPLNASVHRQLTGSLLASRRYYDAIQAAQETLVLDPDNTGALAGRGLAYYYLREYQSAAASCEVALPRASPAGSNFYVQVCLAVAYDKLGRHAEADAQLSALRSWYGDLGAYQYAEVYSQWGDVAKALEWLDTALQLRDGGLEKLRVDPLMDPLRNEPRYQAIERALKFPD